MYRIPTEPRWHVWGKPQDGNTRWLGTCDTEAEAETIASLARKEDSGLCVEIQYFDAVIPDRTLPTPEQIIEICRILHRALVIIRNYGFDCGKVGVMKEIAETLHETPIEMFSPKSWDWNSTLDRLRNLEEKYPEVRVYQMAKSFEEIYGKG